MDISGKSSTWLAVFVHCFLTVLDGSRLTCESQLNPKERRKGTSRMVVAADFMDWIREEGSVQLVKALKKDGESTFILK